MERTSDVVSDAPSGRRHVYQGDPRQCRRADFARSCALIARATRLRYVDCRCAMRECLPTPERSIVSEFEQLRLASVSDQRGMLVVMQEDLPFEVRRVFWIVGADGQTRGSHRHRVTRQALVAVIGVVTVTLDNGERAAQVVLDSPAMALLVEPEDWHTMHFGPGAVLLVFASHEYEAADYIHEPYPSNGV